MTQSLYPPCAGSTFYGPHSAKIPTAYTIIAPGGKVWYACDTDCLRKELDRIQEDCLQADGVSLDRIGGLTTGQRRRRIAR